MHCRFLQSLSVIYECCKAGVTIFGKFIKVKAIPYSYLGSLNSCMFGYVHVRLLILSSGNLQCWSMRCYTGSNKL